MAQLDSATQAYLSGGGTLINGSIPKASPASTTLAQDQTKASNQGKPGYDILGNPTPPSTPSVTPTTISGNKSSQIADLTQKTNDINTGISNNQAGNKAAVLSGGFQYYGDGVSPMSAPADAVQQTDADGHTWYTSGGKNYAIGPDTGLSPEQQANKDTLDKLQAQSDSYFSGAIASVKASYDALIATQKQINTSAEAATNTATIASGSSRYDPTTAIGTNQAQVSFGLQKISDLTAKEMAAISELNQAQQSKNFDIASKAMDEVNKIRADKQAAVKKLNDDLIKANQDAQTHIQTVNEASDSSIRTLMLDAGKSGSLTPEQNKALQTALINHDYPAAIAAAGDSLQTATGQLGDYLQYKKDASLNGLTPLDYTHWKAKDDADQSKLKSSEAYNTAYATAKGKAAGENAGKPSISSMNIPIVSNTGATSGMSFNVPAELAPYAKFSANGTKYADLSSLTKSDAKDMGEKAILAGYRPIFDATIAGDLINISDANDKLDTIKDAFDQFTASNALERNSYKAAFNKISKALQTNPDVAASGVYEIAALDIIKAVSGMKGGRISVKTIDDLEKNFPKSTDDKATADQKIENMRKLMTDRETAAVGKPSASDQTLIESHNVKGKTTTDLINSITGAKTPSSTQSPTDFWNSLTPTIK